MGQSPERTPDFLISLGDIKKLICLFFIGVIL